VHRHELDLRATAQVELFSDLGSTALREGAGLLPGGNGQAEELVLAGFEAKSGVVAAVVEDGRDRDALLEEPPDAGSRPCVRAGPGDRRLPDVVAVEVRQEERVDVLAACGLFDGLDDAFVAVLVALARGAAVDEDG